MVGLIIIYRDSIDREEYEMSRGFGGGGGYKKLTSRWLGGIVDGVAGAGLGLVGIVIY